ncbi:MAG: hypothetical protein VXY16_04300 [Pseudomonadota bacterium]|nr:hypothetical protein [Pseudomonadota bacterium]
MRILCCAIMAVGIISWASDSQAENFTLTIRATIINLTLMPLEDAIAFCDERNLECPALRFEADEKKRADIQYAQNTQKIAEK